MIDAVVSPPLPLWRRLAGAVLLGLIAATLILYAVGVWNPWRVTILLRYFNNLALGLSIAVVLGIGASWLLLPVRSEAIQQRRSRLRLTLAATAVFALACSGLWHELRVNGYDAGVVARSPFGDREVAEVFLHGSDEPALRVWTGTGLATRDAGDLGLVCGHTTVTFVSADLIRVETSYRDWDLPLDPETGQPLETMGPTCSG